MVVKGVGWEGKGGEEDARTAIIAVPDIHTMARFSRK